MTVAKSSFLFATGTLLSRVTGLVRDAVFVGVLGATALHDAFLVAFRIPNLLREMFAEGALGSSFTKVYSTLWEQDRERARRLLCDTLWLCTIISVIVCGTGMVLSPELVRLMTFMSKGRAEPEFIANTIALTRLLFPYLGLTMLGAIVMGALHQRGRFFTSAVAPIAFNLGNVAGAVWLAPLMAWWNPPWLAAYMPRPMLVGLALGVLIGGLWQLIWQLAGVWGPVLKGLEFRPWRWPWTEDVKKVMTLMLPATLAASTGPVNVFVNTNFATQLGAGAVTWLNYAFRLLQLPIGVFGVAVGSAVLPRLARALARSPKGVMNEEASQEFQSGCELVLWLTAPCALFLMLENEPVIRLLFQHGAFTAIDTTQTARALYAYSFGMIGYGLIKVLTSFFYAVERTGYAMRVALICMVVNYVSNSLLVERFGHTGLAMTSSVVLSANAAILIAGIVPHKPKVKGAEMLRSIALVAGAAGLAALLQTLCAPLLADLESSAPGKIGACLEMAVSGAGIAACFTMAGLWRLRKSPRQALALVNERLRRGGRKATPPTSKPSSQ